jgi:multiple sugar transport system substrate-binding protein
MKKTGKYIFLILVLVLPVFSVFGGGQTSSESRPDSSGAAPAAKNPADITGEISFWTAWSGPAAAWIAEFNKVYPNIKVNAIQYANNPEGNLKVNATLMAGQEIDVLLSYNFANYNQRAASNLFYDLSAFAARDKVNFTEEWGLEYKTDGKIFGVPATGNTDKIFVNKKMFADAGIRIPETWTMDEYMAIAEKLSSGTGASRIYGSSDMHSGQLYWSRFARGVLGSNYYYNAEGLSNFDHPAFAQSLRIKYDMEEVKKIQFPYLEYKASGMQAPDAFITGRTAMTVCTGMISRWIKDTEKYPRDFEAAVLPMPLMSGTGKNYNDGIYYFSFLSISAKSKYPEAAWEFVKWMSTRGAVNFAEVGHVPMWKKSDKDAIVNIMFGPDAARVLDIDSFKKNFLNFEGSTYLDDIQVAYPAIEDAARTEMEYVMTGEKSVRDAMAAMKAAADKAIKAAK